jgi:hypothetical protein
MWFKTLQQVRLAEMIEREELRFSTALSRQCQTSDEKAANRWAFRAHAAVSRRPPLSLCAIGTRTHIYTYAAESLGFVHRSRTILCRPVPNPNDTIRNFAAEPLSTHSL